MKRIDKGLWTKNQKDFVGSSFYKRGNHIEVIGVVRDDFGRIKFELNCSSCSQDKELFPNIFATKGHIKDLKIPCLCSKRFKPTENQLKIMVERKLTTLGYTDISQSGDFKGKEKTWFIARNLLTGNVVTMKAKCILGGEVKSTHDKMNTLYLKWDAFIKKISKYYPSSIKIVKDLNKVDSLGIRVYYKYYCPICRDKYGVDSFPIKSSSLEAGQVPCMCNPYKLLTNSQKELKCRHICEEDGISFIGICEDGEHVEWVCENGHNVRTFLPNFINKGTRCRVCRDLSGHIYNGYYHAFRDRKDTLYVLEWKDIDGKLILKVGRSFNVDGRISAIPYKTTIIHKLEGNHEDIYKIEQEILNLTSDFRVAPEIRFKGDGECRGRDSLEIINKFFTY